MPETLFNPAKKRMSFCIYSDTMKVMNVFQSTEEFDKWVRNLMSIKTKTFDVADFLDDEETIAEYLNMALEDPNPEMLLMAVKNIARARGMAQLAHDAGLGRESLYKALSEGAKPRYDTVLKVLRALGVKLHAEPIHG